jgi:diguanylate cyclase (GGDEF)-like protein
LVSQASWGESSRQILDALGFARTDSEVYRVVAEALELVDDEHPSALLMAPSSSSRELHEVAVNTATGSPGCQATHTDNCLAIRRGQVVVTDSSEAINACPQLRGRPGGPCSAVCVPVAVEGHSVGVVHAIAADRHPPEPQIVERLADLSRQVGARIGSLRALESSRAEASTDGLTGLPNRRTLESGLQQMLDAGRGFVAVLADLDKFKSLNDTFGHEAGDRALQLFAKVMQDNVRGHDIVSRVGGEEFVVVYPDMTVQGSIEAIERLRTGLASAVAVAAVQPFTCSFGVTHSSVGATVAEILRVADAGLLRAKELGGDQVIYADQALAAEVFDHGDGTGPSRSV